MKRVLVIEDNDDNQALITFILQHHGYETQVAATGMAGVNLSMEEPADFILLDIQLPDIDGYEVLRRLRSSDRTASIPVIALTSHAMAGDRERLLAAGCTHYLEKPIDPRNVVSAIEGALGDR